jgi:hypothetical protein
MEAEHPGYLIDRALRGTGVVRMAVVRRGEEVVEEAFIKLVRRRTGAPVVSAD